MRYTLAKLMVLVLLAPFFPALDARAQQTGDFDSVLADAYASFRSAYWYTRTGNPSVAAMEILTFDMQWSGLRKSFEAAPPDAYAADPEWQNTLIAIHETGKSALEKINAGDLDSARNVILRIRDELAALRQRNGITAFSDHVNAYWAIIDAISPLRDWERELSEEDWLYMERQAENLAAAVETMGDQAPKDLKADRVFQQSMNDNRQSIELFKEHLGNRFERGAKGSIRDIRSNFGLLFLKYG